MFTSKFQVSGMTCSHCEQAVRQEVSALAGVREVAVSAANGSLVVTSQQPVAVQEVLAAVAEAGYEASAQ